MSSVVSAIGLSTQTGTSGIAPDSARSAMASRTISVRSTAKAGTTTLPPRRMVRRIASAMTRCSGSTSGCVRSPYVDSTTTVRAAGGSGPGQQDGMVRPSEVAGEEHARAVDLDEHAR